MKKINLFSGVFGNKKIEHLNKELEERNEKIKRLEKTLNIKDKVIETLEQKLDDKKGLINVYKFSIDEKIEVINILKKEKAELASAKGGLVTRVNNLTKELEETKKKLEESMTDKYLIKKIPSGKVPKGQAIRSKARSISNQERKRLDELGGLRESNDE